MSSSNGSAWEAAANLGVYGSMSSQSPVKNFLYQ